ncbi:MAG: MFS transporter [Acidimicrobiia bacterium]|nr:MFS transporter [Acidimicrobiia bacterium]
MTTVAAAARRIFSSLRVLNYRLYFTGQAVSLSGTWMQSVAQGWLVLELTDSGTAIGLVLALQFLPVLLFGPMGGVIADRFDKRRLLLGTQVAAALLAATLGLLVLFDVVRLWMVFALACGLGFVNLVDNPTRQAFVGEMVGPDDLTNAISLNSVLVNLARVAGPAAAGALILTVGLAPCFLINAASYLAAIAALLLIRPDLLRRSRPQARRPGQLRAGLRYVGKTPALLIPLIMMAVVGALAYEFQVSLPLLARFTFGGDAGTYGSMTALMGAGAVVGGLLTAAAGRRAPTALATMALLFGAVQTATAFSPTMVVALAMMVPLGASSIAFLALGNATLQLASTPEMRGRVMALWGVAFLGSTPVGGPIIGWIGSFDPRWALGVGGVATLVCAALAFRPLARVIAAGAPPLVVELPPGKPGGPA